MKLILNYDYAIVKLVLATIISLSVLLLYSCENKYNNSSAEDIGLTNNDKQVEIIEYSSAANITSVNATVSTTSAEIIVSNNISTSEQMTAENDNSSSIENFTYEDALYDYNYFCELLTDSYPFSGVLKRQFGVTDVEIKNSFLDHLNENKDNMTIQLFAVFLDEAIKSFRKLGHFGLLDYETYRDYKNLYADVSKDSMNYTALHDSNVNNTYQYFLRKLAKPLIGNTDAYISTNPPRTSNDLDISLKILDNNIAYMKIPQMYSGDKIDSDFTKIKQFYLDAASCNNLIIDITGNGGGSDSYWRSNIIAPNITEPIEYSNYFFIKQSEINSRYTEEHIKNFASYDVGITQAYKLPKINLDDIKIYTNFYRFGSVISPLEAGKKLYNGNIFVLIDEWVYSSAESFAQFCQQTGFAKIVGKNSNGDGPGFDPMLVVLPKSGLLIRYSILYGINEDGSGNEEFGTTPDYICLENESPLDTCIRIINNIQH